jgi:hypothetical protein
MSNYRDENNPHNDYAKYDNDSRIGAVERAAYVGYKDGYLAAEKELGWHRKSDTPIPKDRRVLVSDTDNSIAIVRWEGAEGWYVFGTGEHYSYDFLDSTTHWREIPEVEE